VEDTTKEENLAQPMEKVMVNSVQCCEKDRDAKVEECAK
jgi:hypothetical protein